LKPFSFPARPPRGTAWLGLLLLSLVLAGCADRPGRELVKQQVTGYLMSGGMSGVYEVSDFRVIQWIPQTQDRNKNAYVVEVRYTLTFKHDLKEVADLSASRDNPLAAGLNALALGLKYGNFRRGEQVMRLERFRFERTKDGWVLDTGPSD
jgi:hypothetical protein